MRRAYLGDTLTIYHDSVWYKQRLADLDPSPTSCVQLADQVLHRRSPSVWKPAFDGQGSSPTYCPDESLLHIMTGHGELVIVR
jgi:hypothetical protein